MQNPITKKSQQGFTLIELLIVVAIIGILAAIAIPQYAQYRTSAQNNAAKSELKNIQTSLEGYYTTEGYEYPGSINATDFSSSSNVETDYAVGTNNQTYAAGTFHKAGDTKYIVDSNSSSITETGCGSSGGCSLSVSAP